jgi:uncharacterized protein YqjF (DUF2071 family)
MTPGPGSIDVEPVTPEPPRLGRRAVMRQRWTDLAYLHWRYEPGVVQALLPDGVTVDTHDGDAWVGLVPFVMRDVRLGPLPPVPYFGTFVEINVRTYVVDPHGRRAVWFWSLDVPRSIVVAVARSAFGLPYCWASGASHTVAVADDGDRHRYRMPTRTWPRGTGASVDLEYTVGDRIPVDAETELDHFLTARWALLTERRGRIRYGRVHHERWPLRRVVDARVDETAIVAAGLPSPEGEPHLLCTDGVGVSIGWLERRRHRATGGQGSTPP